MFLLFIIFSQVSENFLFTEEEMTTTPLLIPVEVKSAPANITVFTHEYIEAIGVKTLADLLNLVEGCYTSYSERHIQRAWIRGIGGYYNDRILLLLDGVPLREIIYGHAFIDEYLPLENLEKVEIIKGPSSSVYGTNAFAGVINLITKKKFKNCEIRGRKGMHQLDEWIGEAGYYPNKIKVNLFGKVYRTQGDGQSYSERGEKNALGEDPVRESAFTGKFSYKKFTIMAGYMNFHHKYPVNRDIPRFIWENNWFHYYTSFVQASFKAGVFSTNAFLQNYNNWSFYQLYDKIVDTTTNTVDYRVTYDIFPIKHSRIYGIEPRFNLEFNRLKFVFGGNLERTEVIDVRDLYYNRLTGDTIAPDADTAAGNVYDYWMDPRKDISYSLYGQGMYISSLFEFIAGARYDNFLREINGENLSPRLALSLYPFDWLRIKLLYATAFRNASVRERFVHSKNPHWPSGNPSLIPERIKTYESIVIFKLNKTKSLKISGYRNEECNAINVSNRKYINDSLPLSWNGIEVSGIWIRGLNEYFLNTSCILNEVEWVPKVDINMGIIYRIKYNYLVVPVIRWVSERKGKGKIIPSYFNANLTLSRKIGNLWFRMKVSNILGASEYDPNIRHPEKRNIERPGRQAWIEIVYDMD